MLPSWLSGRIVPWNRPMHHRLTQDDYCKSGSDSTTLSRCAHSPVLDCSRVLALLLGRLCLCRPASPAMAGHHLYPRVPREPHTVYFNPQHIDVDGGDSDAADIASIEMKKKERKPAGDPVVPRISSIKTIIPGTLPRPLPGPLPGPLPLTPPSSNGPKKERGKRKGEQGRPYQKCEQQPCFTTQSSV